MISKLKKRQIIILLLTAAVTSIAGITGLSEYRRDYYVSAALSRAIFSGILAFTALSPLFFISDETLRKINDRLGLITLAVVIVIAGFVLLGFLLQ